MFLLVKKAKDRDMAIPSYGYFLSCWSSETVNSFCHTCAGKLLLHVPLLPTGQAGYGLSPVFFLPASRASLAVFVANKKADDKFMCTAAHRI